MAAWRNLGALIVALATVQAGWSQPYSLGEPVQVGDCSRIHIDMKLTGELRVIRNGKEDPLKLAASATHEFPERVLSLGENGLPNKTARVYEQARAQILAGSEQSERTFRTDRKLFVAQRFKDQPLVYCPTGPLTREELELTEHFDTLCLGGLLPGKAVSLNDTWKISNSVAQILCSFEGLTDQDITCKLEEVKEGQAHVSVTGSAGGIDVGAEVKLKIEGRYAFDLASKRLVQLEWRQKETREKGPANPASSMETITTLKRTALEEPTELSNPALVSIPEGLEPPAAATLLFVEHPKKAFDLIHSRDWHSVSRTNEHLVMRFMEDGDFIAQVTVTPWLPSAPGHHLSPDEFRDAMNETTGWEIEKELQAGEVKAEDVGHWIYRISALGQLDGVSVMQNFYLVANADGQQVVLVFSLTPKQVAKLGVRDLSLVQSLGFPIKK